MENKLNIAELLKHCPTGMELDCTMFEHVTFYGISNGRTIVAIRENVNRKLYLNEYGCPLEHPKEDLKCVIFPKGKTTWEGFVPPYQFKDGDIVFSGFSLISIFKGIKEGYCRSLHSYVSVGKAVGFNIDKDCWTLENIRLATEEEKQKLFQSIKDNGYKWNAETKTLEKLIEPKFKVGDKVKSIFNNSNQYIIKGLTDTHYTLVEVKNKFKYTEPIIEDKNWELVTNKFDISTLVPFESKVLVRDSNGEKWRTNFWGFYDSDNAMNYPYECCGASFAQCIPYEGNEHLCGTTDDCDNFYKVWEK